jgi:4-amino-4-deoxy-L-arabinose transferase-like glycosyltransferase
VRTQTAIPPGRLAARWPVLAMAGALGLLLLLTSGRYGYFGDELYFWAAGYHLDWSSADQPPLLPLLARLMDTVFPGSLVALRIPAAACAVGSVLFAAAIARQLGGSRRAELLTAAAVTGSPVLATSGHVLTTTPVDTFLWIVLSWLLVRWIRSRDDRLLLWAGVVTAVTLQAKYLIVFLWLVAGIAALTVGPRDLLRRKLFWVGAGIAAGTSVPAVLWQAAHGWPQLSMGAVLAGQQDPGSGGAAGFVLLLLASAGVLGVPLLGYGLWRSLRSVEHRFFGWTFLGLVLVLLVTFGHGYYATGMFVVLWAIGAVRLDSVRWMPWVAVPAFLLSLMMVVALLPVRPVESLAGQDSSTNPVNVESVGWPEMADSVAAAYRELSSEERARTVILTDHYWSASAVARYGPARGLPSVYSPHRGFWYFGAPPENASSVLYVGQRERLDKYFTNVRQVAVLDNGLDVRNTFQGAPVWLFEGLRTEWAVLWPELRFL